MRNAPAVTDQSLARGRLIVTYRLDLDQFGFADITRSWPFTVLLASYRAEIGKGPGRVRVACYICDPMIRLSNAAKACQAGVIPMGTDRATVAKTTGAAHMVERWMRRIEMTS